MIKDGNRFIDFIVVYSHINWFYFNVWNVQKGTTYESFVEGGKEGIKIAVSIIPFLVGMLVAISIFRASGALDYMMNFIRPGLAIIGVPAEIAPACFHKADFWNGSTWNDE